MTMTSPSKDTVRVEHTPTLAEELCEHFDLFIYRNSNGDSLRQCLWENKAGIIAALEVNDVLESNARVQAKLLADTGRQRDDLVKALQFSYAAMKIAATLPDVAAEYDFAPVIAECEATLSRIKTEG